MFNKKLIATIADDPAKACRKAARNNEKAFPQALEAYINVPGTPSLKTAVHQSAIALVEAHTKAGQAPFKDTAFSNFKAILSAGGDLSLKDSDHQTPLEILIRANSVSVMFALSKLSQDPDLAHHPIHRLAPLFLPELQDFPNFSQIDKPDIWGITMLIQALDQFLLNPVFPVQVRLTPKLGYGLFATADIEPGQIVAVFDGMICGLPVGDESLRASTQYFARKGISKIGRPQLVKESVSLIGTHSIEVGKSKAHMLMLAMTPFDIENHERFPIAGFANEGSPNVGNISLANCLVMVAVNNIRKDDEIGFFYGMEHRHMKEVRKSAEYRFNQASVEELIMYLIQTQNPNYVANSRRVSESARSAAPKVGKHPASELLGSLRAAYANSLGLDDKTHPLVAFFQTHFPPQTIFEGPKREFLEEVFHFEGVISKQNLTPKSQKFIETLAKLFIRQQDSKSAPNP